MRKGRKENFSKGMAHPPKPKTAVRVTTTVSANISALISRFQEKADEIRETENNDDIPNFESFLEPKRTLKHIESVGNQVRSRFIF